MAVAVHHDFADFPVQKLKSLGCKQSEMQFVDETAFVHGVMQLVVVLAGLFRQTQYLPVGFLAGNNQLFMLGHGQQKHLHASSFFRLDIKFLFHVCHETADLFFGLPLTLEDRCQFLFAVLPVETHDRGRNGELPVLQKRLDESFLP